MNFADWDDDAVARDGTFDAIVVGGVRWTNRALQERSQKLAQALVDLGVVAGDRVVLLLPSCAEIFIASTAVWRIGAVVVLAHDGLPPAGRDRILEHCSPKALFASGERLRADGTALRSVPHRIATGGLAAELGATDFDALIERSTPIAGSVPRRPEDSALIVYTSGTTGTPKGVVYTHGGLDSFLRTLIAKAPDGRIDVDLEVLPPSAFGGKVVRTRFASKQTFIFLEGFEPDVFLAAIEEHRVTRLPLVPSMGEALLASPNLGKHDYSSLRHMPIGGAGVSASLAAKLEAAFGIRASIVYGMTEAGGAIAAAGPDTPPGSVGKLREGVEARIVDALGKPVPVGESGEIWAKSPRVANGYYRDPVESAARFVDGWVKTGDLGRFDADGHLFLLGRSSDLIIQGGVNIYPAEIINVVAIVPGVRECTAIGIPNPFLGEEVVACVVRAAGAGVTEDEILARCTAELDPRKVPVAVRFFDALPQNSVGKLDAHALRARIIADRAAAVVETELVRELRRGSRDEAAKLEVLEKYLHATIARLVGSPPEKLRRASPLAELGVDSLVTQRLRNHARSATGIELPPSGLTGSSIATIAVALLRAIEDPARAPQTRALPLVRVDRGAPLLTTLQQERMWFFYLSDPEAPTHNTMAAWRIAGQFDTEALRRAFAGLLQRHEVLRTTYAAGKDGLEQHIHPGFPSAFEVAAVPAAELDAALLAETARPFDLRREAPVRAKLIRVADDDHVLVTTIHHIATDGWSMGVLGEDLTALYAAERGAASARLPELPVQHSDYAAWQHQWLASQEAQQHLAYWREQLRGAPATAEILTDRAVTSGRSSYVRFELDEALVTAATSLAASEGATLFTVLLAVFDIVIARHSGLEDIVVGTMLAGRTRVELEPLIGNFVNAIPLRARLERTVTFRELLRQLDRTTLEAVAHQDVPFERILSELRMPRVVGRRPAFLQMMLVLHNLPQETLTLGGAQTTKQEVPVFISSADLMFRFWPAPNGGSSVLLEYDNGFFEAATAERFAAHFRTLLEGALARPDERALALPLARPAEREQVLAWSRRESAFVLDPLMQPAPVGVPGLVYESHASGDVVVDGVHLSRTAARARWLANGTLERLGGVASARPTRPTQRVVIAATFTAEPVRDSLAYWVKQLGTELDVVFAPYGQVFQMLLDPSSMLATNAGGVNVLLLRLEDWPSTELASSARELVSALTSRAETAASPFVIVLCPSRDGAGGEVARAEELVRTELLGLRGVYVVGPEAMSRYRVDDVFDPQAERLGAVPYTSAAFAALGTTIARTIHGITSPPYKVVAVDADETLWKGVVGEDGVMGVTIDPPRRALQERLVALHEAGVQICIVSKNQEADVVEVLDKRASEMVLSRKHITALRVNWLPKSDNLRSLSDTLGLGLDSFVFLDDNPVECAEVRGACPDVLVVQVPKDGGALEQLLDHVWAFDRFGPVTAEDKRRADHYKQTVDREILRARTTSLGEFLDGLRLEVDIAPMQPDDVPRVAQLTQRTNQFNATTRRRTEQELVSACEPRGTLRALVVRVRDCFGDYGLVGVTLFETRGTSLWVDTLLMSCRALGRGVEHRILAYLAAIAERARLETIAIPFSPTSRNEPARAFLAALSDDRPSDSNGDRVHQLSLGAAKNAFQRAFAAAAVAGPRDDVPTALPSVAHARRLSALEHAIGLRDARAVCDAVTAERTTRRDGHGTYAEPRTETERALAAAWAELLGVDRVGRHDDFFALGGDSLAAVRMLSRIFANFQTDVSLEAVLSASTLSAVAERIEEARTLRDSGERGEL